MAELSFYRHQKLQDGAVLPAEQSPQKAMKDALDNIFSHPNTQPFILRRLIQRFITFNPSPAFAALIGAVFANNGSDIRDDLDAVINAISLDAEVLDATLATVQCARS